MIKTEVTAENRAAIEREVRAVLDKVWDAARQADFDRILTFLSRGDAFNLGNIDNGVFLTDTDAYESYFRPGFEALQRQDIEFSETRVAVLAPEVAVVTSHGVFSAHSKDGNVFESAFANTAVLVKEVGDWKIVHVHQSFPRPQAV